MQITATLNYLRIGPRKVRLVTDLVKGKDVTLALAQLKFIPKISSRPVVKLINSAVANAKNNWQIEIDNLKIKDIQVDGGPVLDRWLPKAMGRATPIRKRTSHLTVILEEKVLSAKSAKRAVKNTVAVKTVSLEEAKKAEKESVKNKAVADKAKGQAGSTKRRLFSRKTG